MSKVIILTVIVLLIMVILAIIIFNDFGKNSTIFESEEQKANFEKVLENNENENITTNDIVELESNSEVIENAVDTSDVPTIPDNTVQNNV